MDIALFNLPKKDRSRSKTLQRAVKGQSMAEYALCLALICVVGIATIDNLGNVIAERFATFATLVATNMSPP
jgi:Flp pilus assembly pilin Flp